MSDNLTQGSCLCGNVTYEISGEPLRMAQCHCVDCKKSSGTGHMSLAFFKTEQVSISGEVSEYGAVADSGNTSFRSFCPSCGSRLFGRNSAREGMVSVTAGCLDNDAWFKPQVVVYTKDQPGWDVSAEGVPRFEGMPT